MPIRLAVPSPASKLHAVALAAVERLVGVTVQPANDSRELVLRSEDHAVELVLCRATDVPKLVRTASPTLGSQVMTWPLRPPSRPAPRST